MKIGLVTALNINATNPTIGKVHVPMGLLCLGAVLEPAGYEVEIIDPNFWVKNGEIPFRKGFETEIAKRIEPQKYDAIGLSTLASSYHNTLRTACALRDITGHVPIILGGPQATHSDVRTLEVFDAIDAIVRGEGELVLLKLFDALAGDIQMEEVDGITYRVGDKVFKNKDAELIKNVNDLPIPAYHLYPVTGKGGVPLDAGRGCPYHCNFCSTCIFWKHRFRQKSPKRIALEMELLQNAFHVKSVDFTHDLFTLNRENVIELCGMLRAKKIKTTWSCSTRIDAVDKGLLKTMAKSGCYIIYYGVESGSDDMQKIIGKGFDTSIVKEKILKTAQSGMQAIASFIIGFPQETKEDLKKTLDLITDLLGLSTLIETVQLHMLAVTNATKLWNEFKDQLRYDGLQSDQVGNLFQEVKDPLIKKYPDIFPGHYYVKTPHISRSLVVDSYIYGVVVNTCFRWSLVFAARKAGGASKIVTSWHKWRKKFKLRASEKKATRQLKDELMRLLTERILSFAQYLQYDPDGFGWNDNIFDTLFKHEAAIINLRSQIVSDPARRRELKIGDIVDTKCYSHDPEKLIDWLTKKSPKAPATASVTIEYMYDGWSANGPLFKFKRRSHDTFRKRRSKSGHRGRRVSSLPRRKIHRKNKAGPAGR